MGSLKNQILISMPHLTDPFFSKSVVYIFEHNNNGAMGVIINKQFKTPELNKIFDKFFAMDNSFDLFMNDVFFGGPVLLEKGIILHHSDYTSSKSISISKSICITSQQDILGDLKKNDKIPFKLMLGHSGWSSGQLEREIENVDWLIQNITSDFVFNVPPKQMWRHAAKSLGVDLGSSFGVSGQA
jgi:putative transcriptional regulator